MAWYKNTDEDFGDPGPFQGTKEEIFEALRPRIEQWARDSWYDVVEITDGVNRDEFIRSEIKRIKGDLFRALEPATVHVEFSHCGLDSVFSGLAQQIAQDSESEQEAWEAVDRLDEPIREVIYDKGIFTEWGE
jgi:hypothetical protein